MTIIHRSTFGSVGPKFRVMVPCPLLRPVYFVSTDVGTEEKAPRRPSDPFDLELEKERSDIKGRL